MLDKLLERALMPSEDQMQIASSHPYQKGWVKDLEALTSAHKVATRLSKKHTDIEKELETLLGKTEKNRLSLDKKVRKSLKLGKDHLGFRINRKKKTIEVMEMKPAHTEECSCECNA